MPSGWDRARRALAALVCMFALAACGSAGGGKAAASGGTAGRASANGSAGGGSATGGCKAGAAANGSAGTAPQEPDSGVNTPGGKCWDSIKPTPWNNAVIGSTPAGTSTEWKAAWSPTYLYIWASATLGRAPICTSGSNTSWNDDSLEIYVSAPLDTSGAYPAGTGQYVVNACGENNDDQSAPLGTDHSQVNITSKSSEAEAATKTGYTGLLMLAWSDLGVTPKADMVVGFTIGADFTDPSNPGTRLAQTMWQGDSYNYNNDSKWGTLKLV